MATFYIHIQVYNINTLYSLYIFNYMLDIYYCEQLNFLIDYRLYINHNIDITSLWTRLIKSM